MGRVVEFIAGLSVMRPLVPFSSALNFANIDSAFGWISQDYSTVLAEGFLVGESFLAVKSKEGHFIPSVRTAV